MSVVRNLFLTVSVACLLPFAAMAQANEDDSSDDTSGGAPAAASKPSAAVAGDNSPVTHAELEALVKKIMLDNPDIIIQSVQKGQAKQAAVSEKKSKEALKKHKTELMSDSSSPSFGPKNADVTIVEFFDYHCGYCKHLLPTITKLTNEDKNVRVIFKEFPILTEDSMNAARAADAVNRIAPNKYFEYHSALMKSTGKFDDAMLLDTAKGLGINPDKLKVEMAKPEVTQDLAKIHAIAKELGVQGTPALVIGDQMYPGAIPYDDMKKLIAQARSGGKKPDGAAAPDNSATE